MLKFYILNFEFMFISLKLIKIFYESCKERVYQIIY